MSSGKSKKGRSPGSVDNWLDSIGLYRKNVAYDETCLFRAVSEQLFDCQIHHERVRKECVEYGRLNYHEFEHLLDPSQWDDHMDLLEKHMVVCGNIEIQIISRKYNRDVMVFDGTRHVIANVTERNLEQTLMLCSMNEDHYDVVYKKEHIQDAGFCQSIVYGILYENVFDIPNVQKIVRGMLYEKEFIPAVPEFNNNNPVVKDENLNEKDIKPVLQPTNVAPFPFKVAKALDPTIYRNIEFDSWTEVRREMRLGEWYYGDDNLILGTRCILNDNNETLECYIQEIIKNQNKCVVYITKHAEKRTVNYTDLSPEDNAKPWPLPFRFSKNLVLTTQTPTTDKALKTPKKRKDKVRIKHLSESNVPPAPTTPVETHEQYVGAPLQMQNSDNNNNNNYYSNESLQEQEEKSVSQHNLLVTPDVPPPPKFSWDNSGWNSYVPVTPEPVIWPHVSTPPVLNYNIRPMIASAPVTPDVIPYHDNQYPFVYNYHVDNYNNCSTWTPQVDYSTQQQQQQQQQEIPLAEISQDTKVEPETQALSESAHYTSYSENYEQSASQVPQPVAHERPVLCIPPPSVQTNQVEVYPSMIPLHPGTPVIYAHTPEVAEVLMPTTHVPVYTPPVDVQYLSPGSAYIYPPTPPAAWYPPPINSQGFIFQVPATPRK